MKHFEVNNQKYLAVELSDRCSDPRIVDLAGPVLMYTVSDTLESFKELPEGSWEIFGLVKDLSLEQQKELSGIDHPIFWIHYWAKLHTIHNLSDNHLILKQL